MTRPILRVLVSFYYASHIDLSALADYDGPVELFVDSGAYSAESVGATVRLADYASWLHEWRTLITTAANLDVIGDHAASARNCEKLEAAGCKVLPVFHTGSPWAELERLCAAYGYVGVGGMASAATNNQRLLMQWLIKCHRIARDNDAGLHGFGMTTPDVLARLPFYSVDSTTWKAGIRYGNLQMWDGRRARFVTIPFGDHGKAHRHRELIRAHSGVAADVARKGFCLLGDRPREDYVRDYYMALRISATGILRFEEWLSGRHRVPPPPGWRTPGPAYFLGVVNNRELNGAIQAVKAADDAAGNAAGDANPRAALRSRP
ncbi:hypothetical protein [Actinomadura violacea]|uniref:Queuine tRNA-ribosyltransferase n=1 Tax=Actinomadura violacea TaxID=2819934 RepID=A0ABS3RXW0_9ACTN|nr:hypothetical protein [Actinomadura violacea]MBO2461592.1 hypothetical protein [Actinomadura violacea]